ncbi:MAG: cob(I)yrinic acid a,c-diamide adenosyltransferase [Patescibacteria group bacterium]
MNKKNLILVYTGIGKGKTSASLGLAIRALRENMKVIIVQFIKSNKESGEVNFKNLLPQLEVKCFGEGFIVNNKKIINNKKYAEKAINFIKRIIKSKRYSVIILDEIFVAYSLKLIKLSDMLDLIKIFHKSGANKYLVLTGRGCPKSIYKHVDLVTEMKEIKHPFKKGVQAIKGVDY